MSENNPDTQIASEYDENKDDKFTEEEVAAADVEVMKAEVSELVKFEHYHVCFTMPFFQCYFQLEELKKSAQEQSSKDVSEGRGGSGNGESINRGRGGRNRGRGGQRQIIINYY